MHDPDVSLGDHAVGAGIGLQLAISFVVAVVAAGFFPMPAWPERAAGEGEGGNKHQ